jgi:methionyl aminopeptidase
MELDPQFFCTQECFKAFFPIHKFMHKKREETTDTYKYTGPLRPGKVAPRVVVPEDIPKPDWAYTGFPKEEQESKM